MADETNHIKTLDEPAFPVTLPETDDEGFRTHFPGMTLRDWFAGLVMQAIVQREGITADATTQVLAGTDPERDALWFARADAERAYIYADAMIAARVLSGGRAS